MTRTTAALGTTMLLVALSASACSVADAAPVAATQQASTARTFLIECGMDNTVRPKSFTLACADGNESLSGLTWKHWGAASAGGRGALQRNTCRPTCVDGKTVSVPVRVAASKVKHLGKSLAYSELRIKTVPTTGHSKTSVYRLKGDYFLEQ